MNADVSQTVTELDAATLARQKRLLRVVYIMGLVLVLLFVGLIGGVIWKAVSKPKIAVPATVSSLDTGVAAADLRSTVLDGDRLVLTTAKEIVVVDVVKGRIILRMPLQ